MVGSRYWLSFGDQFGPTFRGYLNFQGVHICFSCWIIEVETGDTFFLAPPTNIGGRSPQVELGSLTLKSDMFFFTTRKGSGQMVHNISPTWISLKLFSGSHFPSKGRYLLGETNRSCDQSLTPHWQSGFWNFDFFAHGTNVRYTPVMKKHSNGKSTFSIGNTSSIRVHFPLLLLDYRRVIDLDMCQIVPQSINSLYIGDKRDLPPLMTGILILWALYTPTK